MCGIDYCEECHPGDFLAAWTEGHHHKLPTFGDAAQRRVAMEKRAATFRRMRLEDPVEALEFPEFLRSREPAKFINKFVERMRPNFDRLVRELSDFAAYVNARPHVVAANDYGKQCRKARLRARRHWQERMIAGYLNELGLAALRKMHELFNRTMPWWARAQIEQSVPLLLAA